MKSASIGNVSLFCSKQVKDQIGVSIMSLFGFHP